MHNRCVRRPKVNTGCLLQLLFISICDRVSHWICISLFGLDWPACPRDPPVMASSQCWNYRHIMPYSTFWYGWWTWRQVFMGVLYWLSHLPVPLQSVSVQFLFLVQLTWNFWTQASLRFGLFLLLPAQCWNYRCTSPCLALWYLFGLFNFKVVDTDFRLLGMLRSHSAGEIHLQVQELFLPCWF